MLINLQDVRTLRWRQDDRDDVSNHQPHDCWLNRFFRHRSKKTSKLRVTGLCEGNSPVTGEFPTQRTSNAENVSTWWRHHDFHSLSKAIRWRGCSIIQRPGVSLVMLVITVRKLIVMMPLMSIEPSYNTCGAFSICIKIIWVPTTYSPVWNGHNS